MRGRSDNLGQAEGARLSHDRSARFGDSGGLVSGAPRGPAPAVATRGDPADRPYMAGQSELSATRPRSAIH